MKYLKALAIIALVVLGFIFVPVFMTGFFTYIPEIIITPILQVLGVSSTGMFWLCFVLYYLAIFAVCFLNRKRTRLVLFIISFLILNHIVTGYLYMNNFNDATDLIITGETIGK